MEWNGTVTGSSRECMLPSGSATANSFSRSLRGPEAITTRGAHTSAISRSGSTAPETA